MKLTERRLRNIIRGELNTIMEQKSYDSQYFQRHLRQALDDFDNVTEGKLAEYIITRLNQSYPDGDITKQDLYDIAKEPQIRKTALKADYREFIDYVWETL